MKSILGLLPLLCLLGSIQHQVMCKGVKVPSSNHLHHPSPPPLTPATDTPCFRDMYNPCGLGTCINLGSNSYRCVCPKGTEQSTKINGSPYCTPSRDSCVPYKVVEGDTCYIIAVTFRLKISTLLDQNPGLNCDSLSVGTVLKVESPRETPRRTCKIRYTVTPSDSCTSIRVRFKLTPYYLSTINPGLDCSNLLARNEFLSVCVWEHRSRPNYYICNCYLTPMVASSRKCNLAVSARRTQLFNPGLYCGRLFQFPRKFCFKASPSKALKCKESYCLTSSDSCESLYSKFGGPNDSLSRREELFKQKNLQMQCDDRFLFVGQKICLQ